MSNLMKPKVIIPTLIALALMLASKLYTPVPLPHIQVPAEPLFKITEGFYFTNTMLALLFADAILIGLGLMAVRAMKDVPSGMQNVFEAIVEFWQGQAEQLIGPKLAKTWLPLILTLFLGVMFANWAELIPGFDTVGIVCSHGNCPGEGDEALPKTEHTQFKISTVMGLPAAMRRLTAEELAAAGDDHAAEEAADDSHAAAPASGDDHGEAAAHGPDPVEAGKGAFVPYLRAGATDLNFTLALAIIAFLAIEIAGFRQLGLGYLKKFFNFDFSHGIGQGFLNIFVGLLEFVSELSRIVSFAFRLFGNIFAGQTLLFVMPFLIPLFLVLPIYGLELFVGMIQGFVFAILTLAFMSQAIEDHSH